jgi:ATP-dependent 26S proteasome regulatory subunit
MTIAGPVTPFKTLKELSKNKSQEFLESENIYPELEYTNALKELKFLRNQVSNIKGKEEEVNQEIKKLEEYNQKMEILELNISNLKVKVGEYSLLVKEWEDYHKAYVLTFAVLVGTLALLFFYFK